MSTNATDYLYQTTRITRDGIYFGDEKVPGLIAEDGITFHPGGSDEINTLTVTFLVGAVEAVGPVTEETNVEWPAREVTRYSCPVDSEAAG